MPTALVTRSNLILVFQFIYCLNTSITSMRYLLITFHSLTFPSSTPAQRSQRSASEHGSQSLVRFAQPSRLQFRPATVTSIPRLPMATKKKSARASRTVALHVRSFGSQPSSTTHGTSASKRASTARSRALVLTMLIST